MPDPKDQGKVEGVPQEPLPGQSAKLPERDFFSGDNMGKFIEQLSELSPPPTKVEPAPVKPAPVKKEPCEGCDDEGKPKATPQEERKPIKMLKVKGKEVPVYSEEELVEFAQKGAYMTQERQKDAQWEKDLEDRETKLESMRPALEKLVNFIEGGGRLPGEEPQTKPKEAEPEEEILDPVAAKKYAKLEADLNELKRENANLKKGQQFDLEKRAQTELTETFTAVTKEHPFEQVVDPEDENRNITQELYAGLVSFKANRDYVRQKTQPGFKMRPLQEYMADAAKDLAFLEKHHKSGVQAQAAVEITPETVKTKYPKVAEDLGREAIEIWLKSKEAGSAPVVKSSKTEPGIATAKKEIKGLEQAISDGLADPEIAEKLEEMGREHRLHYGG